MRKSLGCLLSVVYVAAFVVLSGTVAGDDDSAPLWFLPGVVVLVLLSLAVLARVTRRFVLVSVGCALLSVAVPSCVLFRRSYAEVVGAREAERVVKARREAVEHRLPGLRDELAGHLAAGRWDEGQRVAARLRALHPDDPAALAAEAALAEGARRAREPERRAKLIAAMATARELAADPARCSSPAELGRVWADLRQARLLDPEWSEASRQAGTLERCRSSLVRQLTDPVLEARARQREKWVEAMRDRFLAERGAALEASFVGLDRRELKLTWPLLTEAIAREWTGGPSPAKSELLGEMTRLGFVRLVWSDGGEGSWSYPLSPAPDDALVRQRLKDLGLELPLELAMPEAR